MPTIVTLDHASDICPKLDRRVALYSASKFYISLSGTQLQKADRGGRGDRGTEPGQVQEDPAGVPRVPGEGRPQRTGPGQVQGQGQVGFGGQRFLSMNLNLKLKGGKLSRYL